VVETWEIMKFTVIKYMKGTQDRGFILGEYISFSLCCKVQILLERYQN